MCDYAIAHKEDYKELMRRRKDKGIEQILEAIKKQLELESKKASGNESASPIYQDYSHTNIEENKDVIREIEKEPAMRTRE